MNYPSNYYNNKMSYMFDELVIWSLFGSSVLGMGVILFYTMNDLIKSTKS